MRGMHSIHNLRMIIAVHGVLAARLVTRNVMKLEEATQQLAQT